MQASKHDFFDCRPPSNQVAHLFKRLCQFLLIIRSFSRKSSVFPASRTTVCIFSKKSLYLPNQEIRFEKGCEMVSRIRSYHSMYKCLSENYKF